MKREQSQRLVMWVSPETETDPATVGVPLNEQIQLLVITTLPDCRISSTFAQPPCGI